MKKLLSCLTAGLLAVQGLSMGAFAGERGRITVGSCAAAPGDTVSLPVEITENPGITALSLDLTYDASMLELLGTADGGILGQSEYLSGNDLTAVPYTMSWDDVGETDNTGTGTAVLLSFKVRDGASGSTDVSVAVNQKSTFNTNMTEVPFDTFSGRVTFVGDTAQAPTVRAGTVQASADGTAAVPVYLENNPGIAALSLSIAYDAQLTLLGAEDGGILGDSSFTAGNDLSANPYMVNWDSLGDKNNTGSGTVVLLRFRAPAEAAGTLPVRVSVNQKSTFNMDMEEVAFRTVSGAVIAAAGTEPAVTTAPAEPDGAAVIVDTVNAVPGETVRVPVRLQKNPGVAALSLQISYDRTQLKLLGAEDGMILGKSVFLAGNDLTAVPYTVNWDDCAAENNTGNGVVVTLEFEVLKAGMLPVEAAVHQGSTFNVDMENVVFTAVPGGVNASAAAVTLPPVTTTAKPVTTTAVRPAAGAAVIVDTVSANAGDTVSVPIRLKNNPGVAALSLSISYDTSKLKLLSVTDGKILGGSNFISGRDLTAVPYTMNWDDLADDNNTGNGIVATLEFEVLAKAYIPVSVAVNQRSTFNVDMEEVPFNTVDGAVDASKTVTTAMPVTTTAKPVTTTAKPVTTTTKPVTTTAKPVTTTAKPVMTTAKPVTTTAKPVTTTAVRPAAGAAVIVDTVSANAGDTVSVPIRLKNNPGVAALSLSISYDTSKLKLLSVTDGKILGGSNFISGRDLTAVPYTMNWDDLADDNNTGNGIVATLEFEVLAKAYIPVSVAVNQRSTFNVDMEEVPFDTVDGAVDASKTVTTAMPVTTTAKPVTTTAKSVTTTAKPVTTTAKPATTTAKPVTTTAKPVTTTAKPVTTTAKPVTTTTKPVTTTTKPVTTAQIVTTTKPVMTTVRIEEVSVDGISLPVAGEMPQYTGLTVGDESRYHLFTADIGLRQWENGVFWYNRTDEKSMKADDVFEAGKEYRVVVRLAPNEGYVFPYAAGASAVIPSIKATVNGIRVDAVTVTMSDIRLVLGEDTPNVIAMILNYKDGRFFAGEPSSVTTTAQPVTTSAKPTTTTAKPVTTAAPVTTTTAKIMPEGAAVIVDTISANAGDTVSVPIRLQKNPGVAALSLSISYDTSKLKLLSVTDGKILGGSNFISGRDLTAVPYTMNWDDLSDENNTGNGIVVTLEFEVLAAAYIPVSVAVNQRSTFNVDMEEVPFDTVDGAVDASKTV
ncbi:MAG: hypothetical protein IKH27_10495, partial [Oscillospiraceae bacterium]|nr:hypothetical protein [Oscillospiraceae bacterium]